MGNLICTIWLQKNLKRNLKPPNKQSNQEKQKPQTNKCKPWMLVFQVLHGLIQSLQYVFIESSRKSSFQWICLSLNDWNKLDQTCCCLRRLLVTLTIAQVLWLYWRTKLELVIALKIISYRSAQNSFNKQQVSFCIVFFCGGTDFKKSLVHMLKQVHEENPKNLRKLILVK